MTCYKPFSVSINYIKDKSLDKFLSLTHFHAKISIQLILFFFSIIIVPINHLFFQDVYT
jgi:hypothetical protein